jgi:hypothetical protein
MILPQNWRSGGREGVFSQTEDGADHSCRRLLARERASQVGLDDGRQLDRPDPGAVAAEIDDLSLGRVKGRVPLV